MLTLERHAGLWSLTLFSGQLLVLFGQLWRLTGIRFFERWFRRLSWMLPLFCYFDYRTRGGTFDPNAADAFLEQLLWQTRKLYYDSEFLAAHFIPHVGGGIILVWAVQLLKRRGSEAAGAAESRWGEAASGSCE